MGPVKKKIKFSKKKREYLKHIDANMMYMELKGARSVLQTVGDEVDLKMVVLNRDGGIVPFLRRHIHSQFALRRHFGTY